MNIQNLRDIEKEVERFMIKLHEAIKRSKENKGYLSNYGNGKNEMIGVGDINGTKESGAVKRAAMDLKRELTKITI